MTTFLTQFKQREVTTSAKLDETIPCLGHIQTLFRTNSRQILLSVIIWVSMVLKRTVVVVSRILQPYNICVAHKPITTLRQLLSNDKDKDEPITTDKEQYTRSNAATARPLTLVRLAEI